MDANDGRRSIDSLRESIKQRQSSRLTESIAQEASIPPEGSTGGEAVSTDLGPVGCFALILSNYSMVLMLALLLICGFFFRKEISRVLGFGGPDFSKITASSTYEQYQSPDRKWSLSFKYTSNSEFAGLVRYVAPDHDANLDLLTHDILVTTGDYSDPKIVNVTMSGHIFLTSCKPNSNPGGTINLLHVVPANNKICQELCRVAEGDQVDITGWEILKIEAYDMSNNLLATWQDMGCNSTLVHSVSIRKKK